MSEHILACLSVGFLLQACLASAKLPSFGRYSYVTYPIPKKQIDVLT